MIATNPELHGEGGGEGAIVVILLVDCFGTNDCFANELTDLKVTIKRSKGCC
jgi:hypothetical protein